MTTTVQDYSQPGTLLPNGAVVIQAHKGWGVLAVLPDNRVTPWVEWSGFNPSTGDCFSGTYFYSWADVVAGSWVIKAEREEQDNG